MANAAAVAPAKKGFSYYYFSLAFTAFAVVCGFLIGGVQAAFLVAVLAVLETSLSFDNAVVNATILRSWDHKWRQIFLTWGIWIAVFGMRVVFPIAIVWVLTGINPYDVTVMALTDPDTYAKHLTSVHHQVAGFGGAFLAMVGLGFFFEQKHVYWLEWVETKLTKFGQIEGVSAAITLALVAYLGSVLGGEHGVQFTMAGVWGVVTFVIAHGLGTLLGAPEPEDADDEDGVAAATSAAPNKVVEGTVKAGLAGFLYLEILDASFSFDGVIGAFALTNYLPIIALGLGVGAFFVRSMTIHLVETGKLAEFRYLEHGAFYAILILAGLMFTSGMGVHIPEWVTGLLGAAVIGVSFLHSVHANRKEAVAGA